MRVSVALVTGRNWCNIYSINVLPFIDVIARPRHNNATRVAGAAKPIMEFNPLSVGE
jgi:hypothetical protein